MKSLRKIFIAFLMIQAGLLFTTTGFTADWIKPGDEHLKVGAGAFFPGFDTKLRVDDKTIGEGTRVNLGDDLGFSSSETSFWLGGYWRFAAKHRLSASYFQFDRDASAIAKTDITIGDEIYPAGTRLDLKFKFKFLPISYTYGDSTHESNDSVYKQPNSGWMAL
jgi:hypothetical protein